jgi:hypothetical protein
VSSLEAELARKAVAVVANRKAAEKLRKDLKKTQAEKDKAAADQDKQQSDFKASPRSLRAAALGPHSRPPRPRRLRAPVLALHPG